MFLCLPFALLLTGQNSLAGRPVRWEGTISVTSVQESELLRGNHCVQQRVDHIQVRLQEEKKTKVGRKNPVYRVKLIDTGSSLSTEVKGNCVHPDPICDCKEGLGNCKQNIRSATIQGAGEGQIDLTGSIQYGSDDAQFPNGMFNIGASLSDITISSGVSNADLKRCYDQQQVDWPLTGAGAFSIGGNPLIANPVVDSQVRSLATGFNSGSYNYTIPHHKQGQTNVTVNWSLRRKKTITCELQEVERSWRPQHIIYHKSAEPVSVTAKIVEPEGETGLFLFTLYDVSTKLGISMNEKDVDDDTDLSFKIDLASPMQKDFSRPNKITVGEEVASLVEKNEVTIKVAAYDSGAWGKIKAEVDVRGMTVTCTPPSGNKSYVNIPRDDDENHIADFWEEENGVSGQPARNDQDEKPLGLENGDGLSNYEEYRGFAVGDNWNWISTDPKTKDIFINDEIGLGVGSFTATGLTIHLINAEQYNGNDSRLININVGSLGARRAKGQHGLWLHLCDLPAGVHGEVKPWIGSPNLVEEVCLNTYAIGSIEELLSTIAHELGHAVNLHHPGPSSKKVNCPQLDGVDSGADIEAYLQGGVTSGNVDNIMRYSYGGSVQGRDGNCYRYPDGGSWGKQFVRSTAGTGINGGSERKDAAGRPLPVTGDATWVETTLNNMSLLNETEDDPKDPVK